MILTDTKISDSNFAQPYIFHSALRITVPTFRMCVQYLYVELNALTVEIYHISPQNFIDPIIHYLAIIETQIIGIDSRTNITALMCTTAKMVLLFDSCTCHHVVRYQLLVFWNKSLVTVECGHKAGVYLTLTTDEGQQNGFVIQQ